MEMSSRSWSRVFDLRPTARPEFMMAANSRFLAVMSPSEANQQLELALFDFDTLAKATCANISPVAAVEVSLVMILLLNEEIIFCFIY
jgi:hypothetical protein